MSNNWGVESTIAQAPLPFTGQKQLVLGQLDSLGRATDAHIQLKASDMPTKAREPRLNYNPVGWHNYRFKYQEAGKTGKAWLFDRGHLVGYQFSGLNDEARNLVPETSQLNKGAIAHMDSGNQASMLFYESKLADWLRDYPKARLDYQVTPIYQGNELLPRQIRLAYAGYSEAGEAIPINLGSSLEQAGNDATVVILANESSNATINYLDGTAVEK